MHIRDFAHIDAEKALHAHPGATWQIHHARTVSSAELSTALSHFHQTIGVPLAVPLAFAAFLATTELDTLGHFFPQIRVLTSAERTRWMDLFRILMRDASITVTWTHRLTQQPAAFGLRALVIGQIVSCFVQRPEIATALAQTRPTFALYCDQAHYERDGGVSGGCYVDQTHTVLLVGARLFEGYTEPTPGVSPLLHEFGHMLDGTHRRSTGLPYCVGRFPLLDTQQNTDWDAAKRHEVQRYRRYCQAPHGCDDPPLGHPYVFQTDGEFVAGYWEMFWRNPHAFAAHSPTLYAVLMQYVADDPRRYTTDFMGYVRGNQAFYAQKEPAWPSAIRLAGD